MDNHSCPSPGRRRDWCKEMDFIQRTELINLVRCQSGGSEQAHKTALIKCNERLG